MMEMKMMYFELMKLMKDYEMLNHPDSYESTETLGNVETNKLQTHLNQRLLEDKQSQIIKMFGGNTQQINLKKKN